MGHKTEDDRCNNYLHTPSCDREAARHAHWFILTAGRAVCHPETISNRWSIVDKSTSPATKEARIALGLQESSKIVR
jgi:hypothetical protein